jgi:hypothetical protein
VLSYLTESCSDKSLELAGAVTVYSQKTFLKLALREAAIPYLE